MNDYISVALIILTGLFFIVLALLLLGLRNKR
jgi:hypothetical protein